jgi:hypothetical protein
MATPGTSKRSSEPGDNAESRAIPDPIASRALVPGRRGAAFGWRAPGFHAPVDPGS